MSGRVISGLLKREDVVEIEVKPEESVDKKMESVGGGERRGSVVEESIESVEEQEVKSQLKESIHKLCVQERMVVKSLLRKIFLFPPPSIFRE